ncbi:MAG TPA: PilZ domain-containing protein [Polyangiaceae bacterium]
MALLRLILYREWTTEDEMNTEDRRAPGATRMPFDALVEVGGALGPSFEAQAINVSEEGMHLRTAYLPEQGQPLTCRFDGGPGGQSVLASGEVVWSEGVERGGEFGIRFTDMDAESVESLKRICGLPSPSAGAIAPPAPVHTGSKVRLHIDGLASPMKAKIRDARATDVTVGSDLGFLQVGRQLELEDATSGTKRPASIDRVEVAVDPSSHVPQLVVTLRYSDTQSSADVHVPWTAPVAAPANGPRSPSRADDLAAVEEASAKMKGALAENLSRVGPAVERFAERAKTMVQLLAKRRRDEKSPIRRTTAPAPGGGLHADGRRVVRGNEAIAAEDAADLKSSMFKRKATIAGAVMIAAILGAVVLKKSHHDEAADGSAPGASSTTAEVAPPTSAAPTPAAAPAEPAFPPSFPASGQMASADDDSKPAHKKHLHVAPFGNGPVHHGNVLRLKMDEAIESIEGAQQPTGFVVKVPGRKAVEAAAPLAARDSRIAAIKVTNEGAGAELTVAFKDGVPNYQVSARGDVLVISLAPAGPVDDTMAKKDEKGAAKHGKHKHKSEEQF